MVTGYFAEACHGGSTHAPEDTGKERIRILDRRWYHACHLIEKSIAGGPDTSEYRFECYDLLIYLLTHRERHARDALEYYKGRLTDFRKRHRI